MKAPQKQLQKFEFLSDRPGKAAIRRLVDIGALRRLPAGKHHKTRDILQAQERVADGLDLLCKQDRAARRLGRKRTYEEGWKAWAEANPRAATARASTAVRLASRCAHRAQLDLFGHELPQYHKEAKEGVEQ